MTDLAKLDTHAAADEGAWMDLDGPDGAPLFDDSEPPRRMRIKLLGEDSKVFQERKSRATNKRLRNIAKRGKKGIKTAEELDEAALELVSACTVEWYLIFDGEEVPCNLEKQRWFYETYPWAIEQADEFIGSRSEYLGNS